jgi:hypothetical protein
VLWNRALKISETFLRAAEDDVDLVAEVFEVQFNSGGYSWRDRKSFSSMIPDFDAALAVVRVSKEEKRRLEKQREKFDDVKEDTYKELFGE